MRISDWSSDVCSSDLKFCARQPSVFVDDDVVFVLSLHLAIETRGDRADPRDIAAIEAGDLVAGLVRGAGVVRSEERRVGKECVSTCRSRGSPSPYKNKSTNRSESLHLSHTEAI